MVWRDSLGPCKVVEVGALEGVEASPQHIDHQGVDDEGLRLQAGTQREDTAGCRADVATAERRMVYHASEHSGCLAHKDACCTC